MVSSEGALKCLLIVFWGFKFYLSKCFMSKLHLGPHWINQLLRQISCEAVYQSSPDITKIR